jgi:hypothetical protein
MKNFPDQLCYVTNFGQHSADFRTLQHCEPRISRGFPVRLGPAPWNRPVDELGAGLSSLGVEKTEPSKTCNPLSEVCRHIASRRTSGPTALPIHPTDIPCCPSGSGGARTKNSLLMVFDGVAQLFPLLPGELSEALFASTDCLPFQSVGTCV